MHTHTHKNTVLISSCCPLHATQTPFNISHLYPFARVKLSGRETDSNTAGVFPFRVKQVKCALQGVASEHVLVHKQDYYVT